LSVLKAAHDAKNALLEESLMTSLTRRSFVTKVIAAGVGAAIPHSIYASVAGVRTLSFNNLHTGERLAVEYFDRGVYVPDALRAIDQLLRDFRTGDVHAIDPKLLDLLHGLTDLTGSRRPFEVISGYRSPATNAQLRSRSEGVAAGSLHMQGQAIDIRLADVPLDGLRNAAHTSTRAASAPGRRPTSLHDPRRCRVSARSSLTSCL
jgi:uncharacterized protein YcbK (DUF882 family)